MIEEEYKGFIIQLEAEEELDHPDDTMDYENEEQRRKYLARLDNGELMWFCAVVSAWKKGIKLAETTLGGCDWPSLENFKDNSGYYEDMRDEVVKEARIAIKGLCDDK